MFGGGEGVTDLFSKFYSWVQKWQNFKVSYLKRGGGGVVALWSTVETAEYR